MNRKRRILILALSLVALVAAAYLAVGYVLYNQLSDIDGRCEPHMANRPDQFSDLKDHWAGYDLEPSPYFMAEYETVVFPSREPGIDISGWYVEASPDAPAVVMVHGLGACKYALNILAPAGMLARNGFNVLIIDLRDAGDSTREDGRSAIGNEEFLDVLGAVDWLMESKGIEAGQIGLVGNSLGAATALNAFAQEPAIAAIFVDSPFDNLPQIIREELDRENYPRFLYLSGIWVARLTSGDRLLAYNPYEALDAANGRPMFIVHGTADTRIGVHHTYQLQEKAAVSDAPVEFWIVDGVDHLLALAKDPEEYERRLVGFFSMALGNK